MSNQSIPITPDELEQFIANGVDLNQEDLASALLIEHQESIGTQNAPARLPTPNGGGGTEANPAGKTASAAAHAAAHAAAQTPARSHQSTTTGFADQVMNVNLLVEVPLQITVELGRSRMTVREILDLKQGSVIELNRTAGDPVDVFVNDHLVARGEVVVVDDNFGVRITEIFAANR